jgi:hypothetical protein
VGKRVVFHPITHFHTAYCKGKSEIFEMALFRRKLTKSLPIGQIIGEQNGGAQ